ncbi:MAG: hypothetical protein IT185_08475 [Acidobacteria bacterium]|jgi:adenine-specific DNA methylase|nr:hypothetical protein [Acidobacteriota bacterium]
MAAKTRVVSVDVLMVHWPLAGASCQCLSAFFKEEFVKHHLCLNQQREYYSELAITQAENALSEILSQIDQLAQREDAGELIADLLKKIDTVTNLSAWTDPEQLH